jgi:hypothetical protein
MYDSYFVQLIVLGLQGKWITFRGCPEVAEITDVNIGVGAFKAKTKAVIVRCQKLGTLTNGT